MNNWEINKRFCQHKRKELFITIFSWIINQPSDQCQQIIVGRDFKIDVTNSIVNLRDIIGQVTNTINQIARSSES